jgi:hypothetical protein
LEGEREEAATSTLGYDQAGVLRQLRHRSTVEKMNPQPIGAME